MFFLCGLMECKSFLCANYFNWLLTSPVILDTHAAVEPSYSHNLTEIVFPGVWKWMPPKKKKELVRFRPRLQDKRRRQNRFAVKEWASKLAESDMGSYYNQESSWKAHWNYHGIEFHEFVSEQSELFRPRSSQARDEVTRGPAPYKNRTKYCFENLL